MLQCCHPTPSSLMHLLILQSRPVWSVPDPSSHVGLWFHDDALLSTSLPPALEQISGYYISSRVSSHTPHRIFPQTWFSSVLGSVTAQPNITFLYSDTGSCCDLALPGRPPALVCAWWVVVGGGQCYLA